MLLSVDNDILDNAIKTIVKIAGPGETGLVFFRVVGPNILRISSANKGTGVAMYIPCKVEKKSENKKFAIEPQAIQAAIVGRKGLAIEIKESMVLVIAKRHKVDLVTTAAEAERIIPEEVKNSSDGMKLSQDLLEFIRQNIDAIELKPILETFSFMPVAVKMGEKGTIMVCYDNYHMAFATTKKLTGKIKFSLPVNSLSLLAKEFRGKSYKVHLTESALYAYNDSFELALPLPQQDAHNIIPADEAFALAKAIRQEKGIQLLLAAEDMKAVAQNIEAVYKKGEHVDFAVDKEECRVTLKSTHGKLESSVRCKSAKAIKFRIGFSFLRDTLSKVVAKKMDIQIVPERMAYFNYENKTFMLALLANEEKKKEEKE